MGAILSCVIIWYYTIFPLLFQENFTELFAFSAGCMRKAFDKWQKVWYNKENIMPYYDRLAEHVRAGILRFAQE
jgi:hypothetical protein